MSTPILATGTGVRDILYAPRTDDNGDDLATKRVQALSSLADSCMDHIGSSARAGRELRLEPLSRHVVRDRSDSRVFAEPLCSRYQAPIQRRSKRRHCVE